MNVFAGYSSFANLNTFLITGFCFYYDLYRPLYTIFKFVPSLSVQVLIYSDHNFKATPNTQLSFIKIGHYKKTGHIPKGGAGTKYKIKKQAVSSDLSFPCNSLKPQGHSWPIKVKFLPSFSHPRVIPKADILRNVFFGLFSQSQRTPKLFGYQHSSKYLLFNVSQMK